MLQTRLCRLSFGSVVIWEASTLFQNLGRWLHRWAASYFTGTRAFSSSNQLATMWIRGDVDGLTWGVSAATTARILSAGATSNGVPGFLRAIRASCRPHRFRSLALSFRGRAALQHENLSWARPIHGPDVGRIVAFPEVGGLHHRYERRAA
jgi:hypothetical protein